jgi:hypothetical protein
MKPSRACGNTTRQLHRSRSMQEDAKAARCWERCRVPASLWLVTQDGDGADRRILEASLSGAYNVRRCRNQKEG